MISSGFSRSVGFKKINFTFRSRSQQQASWMPLPGPLVSFRWHAIIAHAWDDIESELVHLIAAEKVRARRYSITCCATIIHFLNSVHSCIAMGSDRWRNSILLWIILKVGVQHKNEIGLKCALMTTNSRHATIFGSDFFRQTWESNYAATVSFWRYHCSRNLIRPFGNNFFLDFASHLSHG